MDIESGASIQDVQRGKCETGYRGYEKLTPAEHQAACLQVGGNTPSNQANVMLIGVSSVLVVTLCILLGYSIYKRKLKKKSKSNKR